MPTAFVTAPPDAADSIARTLVEEGLAACVNRVPCRSTYRWDGAIHDDAEEILFAKTTPAAYSRLEQRVVDLHPYETPCVERFDADGIESAFAAWRDRSVGR